MSVGKVIDIYISFTGYKNINSFAEFVDMCREQLLE